MSGRTFELLEVRACGDAPPLRVLIAIPAGPTVHAAFAVCLERLLLYTSQNCPDVGLSVAVQQGSLIAWNRAQLVARAHVEGAAAILWLDSDTIFPPDALQRLLAHELPFVAANYPTRKDPPVPEALDENGRRIATRPSSTGLERCDLVGFGCALERMAALREVVTKLGIRQSMDLSAVRQSARFNALGEDYYHRLLLAAAGIPRYVDHDLSQHVGHIGKRTYWSADVDEQLTDVMHEQGADFLARTVAAANARGG